MGLQASETVCRNPVFVDQDIGDLIAIGRRDPNCSRAHEKPADLLHVHLQLWQRVSSIVSLEPWPTKQCALKVRPARHQQKTSARSRGPTGFLMLKRPTSGRSRVS